MTGTRNVPIPKKLHNIYKQIAAFQDKPLQEVTSKALREYLVMKKEDILAEVTKNKEEIKVTLERFEKEGQK